METAADISQNGIILVLLGLCGLCIVTLGVLAAVFFVFAKFAGKNVAAFFLELIRGGSSADQPIGPPIAPRPDFRGMAASSDFEARLAQNMLTQNAQQGQAAQPQTPVKPVNPGYPTTPGAASPARPRPTSPPPHFPAPDPQSLTFRGAPPSPPLPADPPDDIIGGMGDDLGL
jgi:hypothetical protein